MCHCCLLHLSHYLSHAQSPGPVPPGLLMQCCQSQVPAAGRAGEMGFVPSLIRADQTPALGKKPWVVSQAGGALVQEAGPKHCPQTLSPNIVPCADKHWQEPKLLEERGKFLPRASTCARNFPVKLPQEMLRFWGLFGLPGWQ